MVKGDEKKPTKVEGHDEGLRRKDVQVRVGVEEVKRPVVQDEEDVLDGLEKGSPEV